MLGWLSDETAPRTSSDSQPRAARDSLPVWLRISTSETRRLFLVLGEPLVKFGNLSLLCHEDLLGHGLYLRLLACLLMVNFHHRREVFVDVTRHRHILHAVLKEFGS